MTIPELKFILEDEQIHIPQLYKKKKADIIAVIEEWFQTHEPKTHQLLGFGEREEKIPDPEDEPPQQQSRLQVGIPPCSIVSSGNCDEGFSFIQLGLSSEEAEETIPSERRVYLQIKHLGKTICFDAVELSNWFESTYHKVIEGPFGTCSITAEQIEEIRRKAEPFRKKRGTIPFYPVPIQETGTIPRIRRLEPLHIHMN